MIETVLNAIVGNAALVVLGALAFWRLDRRLVALEIYLKKAIKD